MWRKQKKERAKSLVGRKISQLKRVYKIGERVKLLGTIATGRVGIIEYYVFDRDVLEEYGIRMKNGAILEIYVTAVGGMESDVHAIGDDYY